MGRKTFAHGGGEAIGIEPPPQQRVADEQIGDPSAYRSGVHGFERQLDSFGYGLSPLDVFSVTTRGIREPQADQLLPFPWLHGGGIDLDESISSFGAEAAWPRLATL